MKIKLNELEVELPDGVNILDLKEKYKSSADLIIYNGAILSETQAKETEPNAGDSIVLIKKGEIPDREELESLLIARHTPGVYEKVKRAIVGIAGIGGLGSHVAVALARIGVGKLLIADFDIVEPSNLNRQAFNIEQIGQIKVEALRENIKKINPYVKVETHKIRLTEKNTPEIFKEVNILVEAFDAPEEKVMLVNSFSKRYPEKPIVMASGLAGYAPSNLIKTRKIAKSLFVVGDMMTAAGIGCGLMAPRVGIAAHHQSYSQVNYGTGKIKQ